MKEGKEPVVLQITDTQIIDAAQERDPDRLQGGVDAYWGTDKTDERCYNYLKEMIEKTNPDLIIVTGDLVYGEFDDKQTAFAEFVTKMESYGVPWAPVFGNHEAESKLGIDAYCEQLENAEHCLFKQGALTGNSNYTVGIKQGNAFTRVFFMVDSNGCGTASSASIANGQTKTEVGFGQDQIAWYTKAASAIKQMSPDTKLSFAFHIQLDVFKDAYAKYGFTNNGTAENPINIDTLSNKADTDFGYLGADMKSTWDQDRSVYNGLKALGVDSIFVGHEHCNSASVVYEGIRFQYGQKSSDYERLNHLNEATGEIVTSSCNPELKPIIGGSVIPLSLEGEIKNPYIYYCGSSDSVAGLQLGEDSLYSDGDTVVTKEEIGGYYAWKCINTAQSKLFVATKLLKNKSTFTFSVYVPETSTATMNLGRSPEFAIRVKPNDSYNVESWLTYGGQYIEFSSTAPEPEFKITKGEWQTFTLDISALGETCTEWAFNIPAGGVIYLKDISIQ